MSSAYANILSYSLTVFIPLGTTFMLCRTFSHAKLNNIADRESPFQSCFIFKERWQCSFYSNCTSCLCTHFAHIYQFCKNF